MTGHHLFKTLAPELGVLLVGGASIGTGTQSVRDSGSNRDRFWWRRERERAGPMSTSTGSLPLGQAGQDALCCS